MDVGQALEFVKTNNRAVLHTHRADGGAQLTPVTVGWHPDGVIEISSRETAYKVKHLRRDPRATLCLLNDGFFGDWAFVEGRASIVSLPEAMDGLVEYYRRISGEHPDWDDYRAAMERDRRVLVRITPERAGPSRVG